MRWLHVDEAGHDDSVPVVQERPAKHEAPVVPDGDGVDEPSFDLHCRHQLINRRHQKAPSHNSLSTACRLPLAPAGPQWQRGTNDGEVRWHGAERNGRRTYVPAAGPTRPSVTTRSLAIQKWSCGRRLHPSPPKLCSNRRRARRQLSCGRHRFDRYHGDDRERRRDA